VEVWSFFSGALGLDLGLEESGLRTTLAVELDKWCCNTIRINRSNLSLIEGDVHSLHGDNLRRERRYDNDVFLMVGGPPCQSFSPGGRRAGLNDPRGNLIYEYLRLIKEVQPQFFLLENVANLITAALQHRKIEDRPGKHWSLKRYSSGSIGVDDGNIQLSEEERSGSAIRQILQDVQTLGYSVRFAVLDAAEYGAPQHRLRFVMVGSRDGIAPELPSPTHGIAKGLNPFRTVRDAIEDLREVPDQHSIYGAEIAKYFQYIPAGGNWRDLPDHLQREAMGGAYNSGGGKTGFFRRLSWDAPAPTVTGRANRKGSAICHPEFTRPLSVRECARLQGFPDSWTFSGAMSQQYLQVGNAVPVNLAKAVASAFAVQKATNIRKELERHPDSVESMLDRAIKRLRVSARNKRTAKQDASELLFA